MLILYALAWLALLAVAGALAAFLIHAGRWLR